MKHRGEQRGRRAFAGDVAHCNADVAGRQLDVLEEVAADRATRHGVTDRLAKPKEVCRSGQQRTLHVGGRSQFLVEARFLETFQPRAVVDPLVVDDLAAPRSTAERVGS